MIPDYHFEALRKLEAGYGWYIGRIEWGRRLVAQSLAGAKVGRYADIGCGTGGFAREMGKAFGIPQTVLVDLEDITDKAPGVQFVRADISRPIELPFQPDLISLMDVLEHVEDDRALLGRLASHLAPGGRLILTVPAHRRLFSAWDRELQHFRRYGKQELIERVRAAGFDVEAVHHMWSFLVPAIAYRFLFPKRQRQLRFPPMPRWLNRSIVQLSRAEWALAQRLPIPFGTSLILIAKKAAR